MSSVRDAFQTAQPFLVGIGIPLLVGAAGIVMPIQFAQQSSIARIEAKLDDARNDLAKSTHNLTASRRE